MERCEVDQAVFYLGENGVVIAIAAPVDGLTIVELSVELMAKGQGDGAAKGVGRVDGT